MASDKGSGSPMGSFTRSSVHPENLYPNAKFSDRFTSPKNPEQSLDFNGFIPIKELKIVYSHSSGPGGQNVNKVATKVDMRSGKRVPDSRKATKKSLFLPLPRFHLDSANWLSEEVKSKVRTRLCNQLTKEGYLVVKSDLTRSQLLNQADALRKLRDALWDSCLPEKPPIDDETKEKIRKGKIRAARERVKFKRMRSERKQKPEW